MAIPVIMPRQGQSVESCIITEWKKKVGDAVKTGDILFSYETDKSSFEEEAKVDGTLLAVFFNADDDVPCLVNVAVIGNPGETFDEFKPGADAAAPAAAAPAAETKAEEPAAAVATAEHAVGVSPRARAAAEKLHVDVAAAIPTGPNGRVIERDVLAAAKEGRTGTGLGGRVTEADKAAAAVAAPAAAEMPVAAAVAEGPEYEDVKMSNVRKITAKAMHASLTEMAQLTHNTSFDATALMALRAALKVAPESMELPKITINDILLYAVSRVLPHYPDLNANCLGDQIRYYKHVNLGIAVDTPRGLLVPTLRHAETMSLREIAFASKKVINAAREGTLTPDQMKDASFTVSNVGVYGIESFTPVVNPPQVGILGVCCTVDRVRNVDGAITTYPAMGLSLTYDHRAIDGTPASKFLKELVTALENLSALLVG